MTFRRGHSFLSFWQIAQSQAYFALFTLLR